MAAIYYRTKNMANMFGINTEKSLRNKFDIENTETFFVSGGIFFINRSFSSLVSVSLCVWALFSVR